jgi:DNA repair protein RadC
MSVTPQSPHYTGHRQRLRERVLHAAHGLPDYEIVELLLFAGNARQDVKPLAKQLIETFGSVAGVLGAPRAALAAVRGMNEAHIAYFSTVREAALRMLKQPVVSQPVLDHWDALMSYCKVQMAHLTNEQFRVLYLNTKNHLMADECLAHGTVNEVQVYPRQIVKRALELDSHAVILLHNHPSGNPTPSPDDIELTQKIIEACRAVGVVVHDHVVVAKLGNYSFRGEGAIEETIWLQHPS